MEFPDPYEAEKFKKQKWLMFCGTPCSHQVQRHMISHTFLKRERKPEILPYLEAMGGL